MNFAEPRRFHFTQRLRLKQPNGQLWDGVFVQIHKVEPRSKKKSTKNKRRLGVREKKVFYGYVHDGVPYCCSLSDIAAYVKFARTHFLHRVKTYGTQRKCIDSGKALTPEWRFRMVWMTARSMLPSFRRESRLSDTSFANWFAKFRRDDKGRKAGGVITDQKPVPLVGGYTYGIRIDCALAYAVSGAERTADAGYYPFSPSCTTFGVPLVNGRSQHLDREERVTISVATKRQTVKHAAYTQFRHFVRACAGVLKHRQAFRKEVAALQRTESLLTEVDRVFRLAPVPSSDTVPLRSKGTIALALKDVRTKLSQCKSWGSYQSLDQVANKLLQGWFVTPRYETRLKGHWWKNKAGFGPQFVAGFAARLLCQSPRHKAVFTHLVPKLALNDSQRKKLRPIDLDPHAAPYLGVQKPPKGKTTQDWLLSDAWVWLYNTNWMLNEFGCGLTQQLLGKIDLRSTREIAQTFLARILDPKVEAAILKVNVHNIDIYTRLNRAVDDKRRLLKWLGPRGVRVLNNRGALRIGDLTDDIFGLLKRLDGMLADPSIPSDVRSNFVKLRVDIDRELKKDLVLRGERLGHGMRWVTGSLALLSVMCIIRSATDATNKTVQHGLTEQTLRTWLGFVATASYGVADLASVLQVVTSSSGQSISLKNLRGIFKKHDESMMHGSKGIGASAKYLRFASLLQWGLSLYDLTGSLLDWALLDTSMKDWRLGRTKPNVGEVIGNAIIFAGSTVALIGVFTEPIGLFANAIGIGLVMVGEFVKWYTKPPPLPEMIVYLRRIVHISRQKSGTTFPGLSAGPKKSLLAAMEDKALAKWIDPGAFLGDPKVRVSWNTLREVVVLGEEVPFCAETYRLKAKKVHIYQCQKMLDGTLMHCQQISFTPTSGKGKTLWSKIDTWHMASADIHRTGRIAQSRAIVVTEAPNAWSNDHKNYVYFGPKMKMPWDYFHAKCLGFFSDKEVKAAYKSGKPSRNRLPSFVFDRNKPTEAYLGVEVKELKRLHGRRWAVTFAGKLCSPTKNLAIAQNAANLYCVTTGQDLTLYLPFAALLGKLTPSGGYVSTDVKPLELVFDASHKGATFQGKTAVDVSQAYLSVHVK